jgi:hypothetical protein
MVSSGREGRGLEGKWRRGLGRGGFSILSTKSAGLPNPQYFLSWPSSLAMPRLPRPQQGFLYNYKYIYIYTYS